jgi:hypothetical protein
LRRFSSSRFRDCFVAASLKLLRPLQKVGVVAHFRDHLIAASLEGTEAQIPLPLGGIGMTTFFRGRLCHTIVEISYANLILSLLRHLR